MKKIIISILVIASLCIINGANATTPNTSSWSHSDSKPIVKKIIKKPIVKKIIKKPVPSKTIKTIVTQTGSTTASGANMGVWVPLGKEKWPLAVVLYKYVRADLSAEQIAYIDTSIQEIKAGLAYYEQERDPTLTPEKIKINMKAFLSSAINEMSDRDIFQPWSLDAIKKELNWLIDGLGK
jgi:hypothetical protein